MADNSTYTHAYPPAMASSSKSASTEAAAPAAVAGNMSKSGGQKVQSARPVPSSTQKATAVGGLGRGVGGGLLGDSLGLVFGHLVSHTNRQTISYIHSRYALRTHAHAPWRFICLTPTTVPTSMALLTGRRWGPKRKGPKSYPVFCFCFLKWVVVAGWICLILGLRLGQPIE